MYQNGSFIATYEYDAWGKLLSIKNAAGTDITTGSTYQSHAGRMNPIRYRSYYYDDETGFYYLFVCDQEKLDLLLQTSKCHLIIPEEIYEKHPFDLNGAEVYVDRSMPVGANRTARQKAIPNGHDGSITRILFELFLILGGVVFLFMF